MTDYLRVGETLPPPQCDEELWRVFSRGPWFRGNSWTVFLYRTILLFEYRFAIPMSTSGLVEYAVPVIPSDALERHLAALAERHLIEDSGSGWITSNHCVREIAVAFYRDYEPPSRDPSARLWSRRERIPTALRAAVLLRDGGKCLNCGSEENLHCDHVIPQSKGGPTTYSNLQTLCAACNLSKAARMPSGARS